MTTKLWEMFETKDTSSMHQLRVQRVDRMNRLNALLKSLAEKEHYSIPRKTEDEALLRSKQQNTSRIASPESDDDREKDSADDDDREEDSADDESEDSDADGEERAAEVPNLRYLKPVIDSFVQQSAFCTFKEGIKYLANPPAELAIALETRSVQVVKGFLRRNFEDIDHIWVQKLNELGLSKQGIAILLLFNTDGAISDQLFYDLGLTEWLHHCANRLGVIYSRTREINRLKEALKLEVEANNRGRPANAVRSRWLSNLGVNPKSRRPMSIKIKSAKAAIFQWEAPSLFLERVSGPIEYEDLRAQLRNFVVLTGSNGAFEASTCAQYLEDTFGAVGGEVINIVVEALMYLMFSKLPANEGARSKKPFVHLGDGTCAAKAERVSWSCITLTTRETEFPPSFLESMMWICESMRITQLESSQRLEDDSRLLKSSIRQYLALGTGITVTAAITVFSLEPLQPLTDEEIGENSCWTRLFKKAVIPWKPIRHSWGVGLRLDYKLLVHLAAVRNYAYIGRSVSTSQLRLEDTGGLVAFGFFTALIPIAQDPATNSIQWHLETTEDRIIDHERLEKTRGEWLAIDDPEIFSKSPCFLGWKGDVNVLLGTEKGSFDLQWTGLPKIDRRFRFEGFEVGNQIGTGNLIPIPVTPTVNWIFKSETLVQRFGPANTYETAIRTTSHQVAFVCDSGSQTAWLVPQLSWILHLCHVWWNQQPENSQTKHDPIPFANISNDGSSAAHEAL
ncbi:hypothetical protein F5Y14DRAFT_445877 [Nemania sp. NC0429]|nr:hypothetical protein F5Y14DRAFT_445877 [Nemania sp. NC0429]